MSIQIATILGTNRPGNYTARVLAVVEHELRKHTNVTVKRIDPAQLKLPFPGDAGEFPDAVAIRELVQNATAIVLATPEYHGTFAAQMKLIIENLGFPSVLKGKPVALLGVAAGRIGAIKSLEQLRGVCGHVGALVLPGAVSVPGVQRIFDADGNINDASTEKHLRGVAQGLLDYVSRHVCPALALEEMMRNTS